MHVSHCKVKFISGLSSIFCLSNSTHTQKIRTKKSFSNKNKISYLSILYICLLHTVRRRHDHYCKNIFVLRRRRDRRTNSVKIKLNCLFSLVLFFFFSLLNPLEVRFEFSIGDSWDSRMAWVKHANWNGISKTKSSFFPSLRHYFVAVADTNDTLMWILYWFFAGYFQLPTFLKILSDKKKRNRLRFAHWTIKDSFFVRISTDFFFFVLLSLLSMETAIFYMIEKLAMHFAAHFFTHYPFFPLLWV